jgi:hypothetical protein
MNMIAKQRSSEAAKQRSSERASVYHISILYIIRMYYANASEFYEPASLRMREKICYVLSIL